MTLGGGGASSPAQMKFTFNAPSSSAPLKIVRFSFCATTADDDVELTRPASGSLATGLRTSAAETSPPRLLHLSPDTLGAVVAYLSAGNLCRFALTAKSSAAAGQGDRIWTVHLRAMFGETTPISYALSVFEKCTLGPRRWMIEQGDAQRVDALCVLPGESDSLLPGNRCGTDSVILRAFDLVASYRRLVCNRCSQRLLFSPTTHKCPLCHGAFCGECKCACCCRSCGSRASTDAATVVGVDGQPPPLHSGDGLKCGACGVFTCDCCVTEQDDSFWCKVCEMFYCVDCRDSKEIWCVSATFLLSLSR